MSLGSVLAKTPNLLLWYLKANFLEKKRVFLKDQTQFSVVQIFIMCTGLWSFELRLEADTRRAGTHTCTTQAQTTLLRAFYLLGQCGKTWVQSLPTERLELCRETILNIWPLSKYDKNNENKNRHFHAEDATICQTQCKYVFFSQVLVHRPILVYP